MDNNNKRQLPGLPPVPGALPKPPTGNNSGAPKLPTSLPNSGGLNKGFPTRPSLPTPESEVAPEPPRSGTFKRPSGLTVQAPVEQTQPEPPRQNPRPAPVATPSASEDFGFEDEEDEVPEPRKKKTSARKIKTKPPKNAGRKVTTKEQKGSAWGGKRKNVVIARVVVFGIVGLLAIGGIASMIPKSSNLTASDTTNILSQVRQNLNVTDFPKARGEGIAVSFTKLYLNIDPAQKSQRFEELKRYVSEDILAEIDPHVATEQELAAAGSEDAASYEDTGTGTDEGIEEEEPVEVITDPGTPAPTSTGVQLVTDGPYLVKSEMFKGGSAAIFTTMTEINNTRWVFLEVPMYWDSTTDAISISGSPTFSSPIDVATVPDRENTSSWNNDREIEGIMKDSIAKYMKAWSESDTASITRYLHLKDGKILSTTAAQTGLGDTVKFVKLNSFSVEGKKKPEEGASAQQVQDFRERDADISVTFLEPSSGIAYTQNFRLILRYDNSNWFVYDIKNISSLLDRDEVIRLQTEEINKNKENNG